MPIQQIDLEVQSQDLSLTREKLVADFLNGSDLNLTGGNNNATLVGLEDAIDLTSPATLGQLQSAVGSINGNMILQGSLDASNLGSQLNDAKSGYWYKVTVAGTLFATNPIELAVGDNLYVTNDVTGTPTDGADFFKVDNTESADILRDGDVVNNLTTAASGSVLDASQGKILKDVQDSQQTEIDAIEAAAGLNTDGTYITPSGTNYIDSSTSLAGADVLLDTQIKANADALAAIPTDVYGEEPVITVGSPTLAPLANIPAQSVRVYWNGLRAREGASNDYTVNLTTGVITMAVNMKAKDVIQVDYKY